MDTYKFADSEHLAGFHNTYQEECSECYKENRILKAWAKVNRSEVETGIAMFTLTILLFLAILW